MTYKDWTDGDDLTADDLENNWNSVSLQPTCDQAMFDTTSIDVMNIVGSNFKIVDLFTDSDGANNTESGSTADQYYSRSGTLASSTNDGFDIFLGDNGTKLYIADGDGVAGDRVGQYALSTRWNVATESLTQEEDIEAKETGIKGVCFSDTGDKMYIIGTGSTDVNEYDLGTEWDISTAVFNQAFDVGVKDNEPYGLHIVNSGDTMYFVGRQNDKIYEYNLGTSWDISTAVYSDDFDISGQTGDPAGIHVDPSGSYIYIGETGVLNQYTMTSAFDLSTVSYTREKALNISAGVYFRDDGTRLYCQKPGGGGAAPVVTEYFLSTAWDISTATSTPYFFECAYTTQYADAYIQSTAITVDSGTYNYVYIRPKYYEALPAGTTVMAQISLDGGGTWSSEFDINTMYDISGLNDTGSLKARIQMDTDVGNTLTPRINGWCVLLFE